ncbi:MAG: hypothetical protein R3254_09400 [Thiomicrorhabdus sp.]|nr:hypothetical protein [Thiomicrorhabdus sp.]
MEIEGELKSAELIIEAAGWCANEEVHDSLISSAKEIIRPFLEKGNARALWLKASLPNLGEAAPQSEEKFDELYNELIYKAAKGGCPEAQYRYGCNLYEQRRFEEALNQYELAASNDYAPAQWCFGLDTLHGVGTDKSREKGLHYILLAAEQRYEYAVEFMINAYENLEHGFKENSAELKKWKDLLPYCEYRY